MQDMFFNCYGLTSLDVSNWDTSKVTTMLNTFYGCSRLTSLDLSNWDTSSVTNLETIFCYCSALETLNVSNWNTSNVTNMNATFSDCSSLMTLDVSNWITSKVTNMKSMFNNCSKLTSLDVSNWDLISCTSTQEMFKGCSSLESLDLSAWNISGVTNMSSMFQQCSSLVSAPITTFGNNINYVSYSQMYYGCGAMTTPTTLVINGPCNLYAMFAFCHNLPRSITFDWRTNAEVNVHMLFVDSKPILNSLYGINLTSCGKTLFGSNFFGGIGWYDYSAFRNLTCTGILRYSLNMSKYTGLTKESLMEVITRLCDNGDGLTLTLGTTNIAKLTEEEISAITAKGWSLA